jgi:uncharacterized RDD family membrane protein YckC
MSATPSSMPPRIPTVRRRLMVMVYETFLLLAVEMLAVALFLLVTRNSHAPLAQYGLKIFLFLVTGTYFIWCWTDSGHTLAMKTWRLRLTADGQPRVPLRTAALRYLLAWGWFLPALIVCGAFGMTSKLAVGIAVGVGILAWAFTAFLDKDRRFLHDRLAGTRLVQLPKAAPLTAPAAS